MFLPLEYVMKIGSAAHKELFCQRFMDSHRLYEPEQLPWPELDRSMLDRLRGIPFWDEALYTERHAGVMLNAYAETITDPMIQDAIALQAREEARHGRVIEHLIQRYGIEVPDRPPKVLPVDLEPAFIKFGYGECFDSFFAFGLFGMARQGGFIPDPLFTIFDPILDEEARHMVFFVNWIAYKRISEGRGVFRDVASLYQYAGALLRRFDNLKGAGKKGKPPAHKKGFTATGAKSIMMGLTLSQFLETCLVENAQRMSAYDPQLLHPEVLPRLTGVAAHILKQFPQSQKQAGAKADLKQGANV